MAGVLEFAQEAGASTDRRKHARHRLRSLTYAELDRENGGIVLDASEGGISVHAVVPLLDDVLPRLRLKAADMSGWLEIRARVAWTRDSRKVAGLQFEELPEPARIQIRDWLLKEASAHESALDAPDAPPQQPLVGISVAAPRAANDPPASLLSAANANAEPPAVRVARRFAVTQRVIAGVQNSAVAVDGPAKYPAPAPARQSAIPKFLPEKTSHAAPVYVLMIVLAALSLAAGWADARGRFRPVIRRFQALMAPASLSDRALPAWDDKHATPVRKIEIVDADNQRWTIPLAGVFNEKTPLIPKPNAPAPPAAEPTANPGMNFQMGTLTSPKRSTASTSTNSFRDSAPPTVEEKTDAQDVTTIGSVPIGTTIPVSLPKPPTPTGVLRRGDLIHRVEPEYPEVAREQGISGTVTLEATIGKDGVVRQIRPVSGPKMLVPAAINAVRQWRYAPTLLDGKAIEMQIQISLEFNVANGRK